MWDEYSIRIKATKHRIKLNSAGKRQIHVALFRAGPRARELENRLITKMLAMDVIETAQTEWAAPSFLWPRNTKHFGFACTTA